MSEEVTASVSETPGNETTQVEAQEVQATPADNTATETTTETAKDDFSWFPTKYMKDGEPDVQNLAKAYQNLEKKLGQKVTSLAPESADEYDYTPDGIELDPELTSAFKNEAKEAGLSTAQYEFIMKKYQDSVGRDMMTSERAVDMLKQSWGEAEFAGNLTNAQRAFDEFAPSDLSSNDPALNHPSVLKLLARIGADLGEDSTPPRSSKSAGLSQGEIEAMMMTDEYNVRGSETRQTVDSWFKKNS